MHKSPGVVNTNEILIIGTDNERVVPQYSLYGGNFSSIGSEEYPITKIEDYGAYSCLFYKDQNTPSQIYFDSNIGAILKNYSFGLNTSGGSSKYVNIYG